MKTKLRFLLCPMLLLLAGTLSPSRAVDTLPQQPQPPPQAVLEPDLARALAYAARDETLRVIVVLREQVAPEQIVLSAATPAEARPRLVAALQSVAARTQSPVLAYLDEARAAGQVESYTPFWIFNGVAVRARPSAVRALAARPGIAVIRLDHYRQWLAADRLSPIANRQSPVSNLQLPTSNLQSPNQQSVEWGIQRIRAPQVWASFAISGSGVIVAGMDTGADWLHPALQASYRGYNPHGPANHTTSWYDATGAGALYPVDGHGHGTHTLGTAVGQDGIGVAPGAQWIAVRVLNSQGLGYDSWIHAGFQWLLAPGGDPSKAPDVVNCSWSNQNGWLTTFDPDLQALRAAGIFAVFANGNYGPNPGTVGAPASSPEAFAVGASDIYDGIAWFSSRGPSPWGETRPHVVAPGVNVRSSLPGGAYGSWQGTSMAAPHVSGIVALLRSVSPTLSITHTAFIITSTAAPLSATLPNNDSGWGLVDAFAAVSVLAQPGFISGTVTRAGDGAPVGGATVAAAPHGGGGGGTATSTADGRYLLTLAPATFDLTVSAFGYAPATAYGVPVTAGATSVVDVALTAFPTGTLRGLVTDAATGQPLAATITAIGTPLEATANAYTFVLPAGDYTVRARSLGHWVVTATATITAGQVTTLDFALNPAPSVLLVDSGGWYYASQIGYFRQALDDLAYAYGEWPIRYLPGDLPAASDLTPYDIVVWSAPEDAPGYIGAESVITGYLSSGGRLLLSGQDIGFVDGGGGGFFWSAYYRDYLKARFAGDDAPARVLQGSEGDIFAGLVITIAGPGGADNQASPDVVAVADPDAAAPVLVYQSDGCGGIRVGTCLNYRAVYLAFGFEAINDRASRREVLSRALDWLVSDPPTAGLELTPITQTQIGVPGSAVTHTLRLRHVGQGGSADTVSLALAGGTWASQLSAPALTLSPCATATVVVTVTLPAGAAWDARDVVTLTARSSLGWFVPASPTLAVTAVLTTKAPAPILLVDDDRWYDQEAKYEVALAAGGFVYDTWSTHGASLQQGSPTPGVLQRYPLVVWFTGYDWYAPVTAAEERTLATYLDGGGRLFLTSQDFLYYHADPFASDYLGVLTVTQDVTPTLAAGVPEDAIGDRLGAYPLAYPFQNWSDALEPAPGAAVSFRDQARRGIALAQQAGNHRVAFFSFPFETLPEATRPEVMERVVGWLSWLGGSTFSAGQGAASGGDALTYTVALRNDGPAAVTASLSNTLPFSLTLVAGSLTAPATYDDPTRRIAWQGILGPGAAVTFTYQVTLAEGLVAGDAISNVARIGLEEHAIRFHRAAVVRVDAPDLAPSAFECAPSPTRPSRTVTCTLALVNAGPAGALAATAAISLPTDALFVAGSLAWSGGVAEELTGAVLWSGPLSAGEQITLTYRLALPVAPVHPPLYSVAFLDDGTGGAWERPAWIVTEPFRRYFPLAFKNGS